jgi:hypothetical protein
MGKRDFFTLSEFGMLITAVSGFSLLKALRKK